MGTAKGSDVVIDQISLSVIWFEGSVLGYPVGLSSFRVVAPASVCVCVSWKALSVLVMYLYLDRSTTVL